MTGQKHVTIIPISDRSICVCNLKIVAVCSLFFRKMAAKKECNKIMKHNKFASVLGRIFVSAILIFLLFYTMLPAINFHDQNFIVFLIISILIVLVVNFLTYVKNFLSTLGQRSRTVVVGQDPITGAPIYGRNPDEPSEPINLAKPLKLGFILIAVLIGFMAVASLVGIQFFNASRYRDLITITDGDFTEDVAELNMNQIPVVDRDTASRLGSRKLGEMSELVSQFEIQENYTQINYQGMPYRVTPLAYACLLYTSGLYRYKKL